MHASTRSPSTVLYTHASSLIGGGNKVLLSLFATMDRERYMPHSIMPSAGPLAEQLALAQVPSSVIDIKSPALSHRDTARRLAALVRLVSRQRASILHTSEPSSYRIASMAALLTRARRVCHIHHPDVTPQYLAWAFQLAPHAVITGSHYVATHVRGMLPPDIPVLPIWNPVDTAWFAPSDDKALVRARLGLKADTFHISILGALAKHKGHECFLRAASLIHERLPSAQFHIIGSALTGQPDHARSLKALAAELGLNEVIRFWGFVEDSKARDLLQASDLFVLPTQEEGFCLALAEAQACGVPVLTSNIPPLDEVVEHGGGGFLLDPTDHATFAVHAVHVLDNPDIQKQLSFRARQFVLERFSSHAFAANMSRTYDDLLAGLAPGNHGSLSTTIDERLDSLSFTAKPRPDRLPSEIEPCRLPE